ncbi:hypothetical protein Dimus_032243 [Dionaea muscipula]
MGEVGLDGEGTWAETAKTSTTGHGFDGGPVFVRIERTEIDPASFRDTIQLAAMPDSYEFNRGLLLVVQGIQEVQVSHRKTSLAYKMANIVHLKATINLSTQRTSNMMTSAHLIFFTFQDETHSYTFAGIIM